VAHPADELVLREGTIASYDALSRFHYKAARPATHVRVLVLARPETDEPAAVLVVSMPTLNGAWRRLAFEGFASADKREGTRWLNASLRCISRVIVDPRFRGLGLASRLVRAYLARPATRFTEAIATMGVYCPFFRAAGMTEYPCPVSASDARLLDALAHARVDASGLVRLMRSSRSCRRARLLERELVRWARASRRTARRASRPVEQLARLAAGVLTARPIAYAHDVEASP
jgi:GNAT superfamily N-acetyltransferase